jgi:hypothetical protein
MVDGVVVATVDVVVVEGAVVAAVVDVVAVVDDVEFVCCIVVVAVIDVVAFMVDVVVADVVGTDVVVVGAFPENASSLCADCWFVAPAMCSVPMMLIKITIETSNKFLKSIDRTRDCKQYDG